MSGPKSSVDHAAIGAAFINDVLNTRDLVSDDRILLIQFRNALLSDDPITWGAKNIRFQKRLRELLCFTP